MKRGANTPLARSTQKQKIAEFSALYENKLPDFVNLIFSNEPKKSERQPFILNSTKTIIYNQKGYDKGINIERNDNELLGNSLKLKDGTPIGYNIHLPEGEIKGSMVSVYGGHIASDRKELLFLPGYTDNFERALLAQGFAVIQLNLLDLLKLKVFQDLMPKDIHIKLHQSIHHFFETIREKPESLHSSLAAIKEKPIFLFGASFGGRTAIKHAELYPFTYHGYISFNGALSYDMIKKTDEQYKFKVKEWLDPNFDISQIQDPIFLIQNRDDNCVNLKVTLDWYQNAKKLGKEAYIRLWIVEKGSPINLNQEKAFVYKGHDLTKDKNLFADLLDSTLLFTNHSPFSITPLHEWRALRYDMIANKNYNAVSLEEEFVSYAYDMYQRGIKLNDENWEAYYEPLYYTLNYLHSCVDNHDFQGKTLYGFKGQFHQDLEALKKNNLLTAENFTKALKASFETFAQFLKETKLLKCGMSELNDYAKSSIMHDMYSDLLEGNSNEKMSYKTYKYLVSTLYKSNKFLLEDKYEQWDLDSKIQSDLKKVRKVFENKIATERELIRDVWKEAIRKIKQS
ncbi:MAG: hypothetical protein JSS07_11390 [Proteobacteria bacterium]|nr:hypothetical protein [Pseudomonadota bacterium]